MEIIFEGPFTFIDGENDVLFDCPKRNEAGIYLWTVPVDGVYLPTYLGETGDSFLTRHRNHVTNMLGGFDTICDASKLRRGEVEIVWPGLWKSSNKENIAKFTQRRHELIDHAFEEMRLTKIFIASCNLEKDILRRIEHKLSIHFKENDLRTFPNDVKYGSNNQKLNQIVKVSSSKRIADLPSEIII
jgi:hypothetical protein